jgi:transcriptional regulator with XRE-family HTH domain
MEKETIGAKIRRLRLRANLKQSDLADMLSVTNSTISNWETDRRSPSLEELKRIAHVFDTSLNFFATEKIGTDPDAGVTVTNPNRTILILRRPRCATMPESVWMASAVTTLGMGAMVQGRPGLFLSATGLMLLFTYVAFQVIRRGLDRDHGHGSFSIPVGHRVFSLHPMEESEIARERSLMSLFFLVLSGLSLVTYGLYPFQVRSGLYPLLGIIGSSLSIAALLVTLMAFWLYETRMPFTKRHAYDKTPLLSVDRSLTMVFAFALLSVMVHTLVAISGFHEGTAFGRLSVALALVVTTGCAWAVRERYRKVASLFRLHTVRPDGTLQSLG